MWQHHEIGHGLRLLCFELHVFVFIFAIFKGFCIYFRHFHCRSPSFIRVYNIFSRILSAVYQVLNDQVEVQLPKVEVQVQRVIIRSTWVQIEVQVHVLNIGT